MEALNLYFRMGSSLLRSPATISRLILSACSHSSQIATGKPSIWEIADQVTRPRDLAYQTSRAMAWRYHLAQEVVRVVYGHTPRRLCSFRDGMFGKAHCRLSEGKVTASCEEAWTACTEPKTQSKYFASVGAYVAQQRGVFTARGRPSRNGAEAQATELQRHDWSHAKPDLVRLDGMHGRLRDRMTGMITIDSR